MWVGMTGEMLVASRGAPDRTRKVTTAAGTNQVWFYKRTVGSAFRDGECVSGLQDGNLHRADRPRLRDRRELKVHDG